MAAPTTYEIGTALNDMNSLTMAREPQADFQEYSTRVMLADGIMKGRGFPVVTWHFGFLSPSDFDFFKAFCTEASSAVYIATMDNNRDYKRYSCIMTLPEKYTRRNDKGIDVTITFSHLIEQPEPPEPELPL